METLTIHVPDNKSQLVKQLLNELGVDIDSFDEKGDLAYKEMLLKIPTLSDSELKSFEDAAKSFGDIKPPQW